jgi:hypothetical protein
VQPVTPAKPLRGNLHAPQMGSDCPNLVIRSIVPEDAPLPITSTGYCSHFHECGTVEAHGGDGVAQVTAWLDEEAAKHEWQAHIERTKQGELF